MTAPRNASPGRLDAANTTSPGAIPGFVAAAYSEAEIEIAAQPQRVWNLLTRIEQWPAWNALVEKATLSGPLRPGSVFRWSSRGFTVTSTLREVTPSRRIAWTGKAFGTRAFHSWEIEATERGTILRTAEWFGGWLPRMMPGAMQRTLDETLPAWLLAIKAQVERSAAQGPTP